MYLFLSFMYIDSPILTRFGRVHLLSMKMSRTSVSGNIAVLSTLVMNTIMMADNSASSLQFALWPPLDQFSREKS